jgi:long-chain fatty acid transport protein
MIRHGGRRLVLVAVTASLLVANQAVEATDGHFLHGVGAINSAMGGAGVAAPKDLLGTVYLNPAGLLAFEETRVDLGFEMFKAERTIESVYGPFSGATASKSAFVPIPAFAWSTKIRDGRMAVGVAGLGIGGFGVDYAVTPTNPILSARPYGFGQVFSNYQLMKIAPVVAFKVSDHLTLGLAGNVDWATLAVDPFPAAAPAVSMGPDGQSVAYYSGATATDGVFGFGFQAGLLYQATDAVAIGAAYTSPQYFKPFHWQAVYENPILPTYNMPREIEFTLNIPAVYSVGVGVQAADWLLLAGDFRYVTYESTTGFDEAGYDELGAVKGFGWKNIKTVSLGTEVKASSRVAVRGGYNYSDNPVPDEYSMFNLPAPAIVQHHLTAGVGLELLPGIEVSLAYYHAFENSGSGPFVFPAREVPGSQVTNRMKENSFLMQFSFGR